MIRISCSDYTFPLLPRGQRFALLKLLGFNYVDIGLFERTPDLMPTHLLATPRTFIRKLQDDLRSAGMRASDVFLQIGSDPSISAVNDPSQEVISRNRRVFSLALDLCSTLGAKHLTGLPGVWHKPANQADDFARAVEETTWRQDIAREAGVTYAVEAHIGSICSNIESTRALLCAVPGLTLTLDYGHFVAEGISSQRIHPLLRFASHIHVRGGTPTQLQTPVSENRIDFPGMIRRLSQQRYTGFLAVEYAYTGWQQCNRTDNLSETILLRRQLEDHWTPRRSKARPTREVQHV